jgi:hypothetical protein
MADKASGIVAIEGKPKSYRGKKLYSFKLEDGEWYNTGEALPPEKGSYVEFEYSINAAGYNVADMDTLKAEEADEAAKTKPAARAAKKSADGRGAVISWHSSRNAAIELCKAAAEAGALDLGGAKASGKLEALTIIVNRLTVDFFMQASEVEETCDIPEALQG